MYSDFITSVFITVSCVKLGVMVISLKHISSSRDQILKPSPVGGESDKPFPPVLSARPACITVQSLQSSTLLVGLL